MNQAQLYPYYEMGASGCWSIDAWMGPWPVIRVSQACVDGDVETAKRILGELGGGARPAAGEGESGSGGGNPQEFAGYIKPSRTNFIFCATSRGFVEVTPSINGTRDNRDPEAPRPTATLSILACARRHPAAWQLC